MLLLYKDKILNKISKEYPERDNNLIRIWLFGSVAKEYYNPNSDIDILLITKNKKDTREHFSDFKMEVLLNYKVLINAMYVKEEEFDHSIEPIYKEIKNEGIILWEKKKIQNK